MANLQKYQLENNDCHVNMFIILGGKESLQLVTFVASSCLLSIYEGYDGSLTWL